jgi:cyclopropane fatty-acyl-phospholipid synthase-like methyltransferase
MTEDLARYYEEWWENPKDPRDQVFKRLNRVVRKFLPPGSGKTALDVGSGKGAIVAFLREKDYRVTALDLNGHFLRDIKRRFPEVDIVEGRFGEVDCPGPYDLVTAVEFIQNLDPVELDRFFERAAGLTDHLIVTVSNRQSLHGYWARRRRFIKDFVHVYTPREVERRLEAGGFRVVRRRGVGFLTPITWLPGFRRKLLPVWLARAVNPVADRLLPRLCHLYYLEAVKEHQEVQK